MARVYLSASFVLFSLILVLSCSSAPSVPAGSQNAPSQVSPTSEKPAVAGEWDKTTALARKEGKLVIYTTTQVEVRQSLSDAFKKRTGVEVEILAGRGAEIAAKVLTERRAGLYLVDFYLGGTTTILSSFKPAGILKTIMPELFLPEVLDTKLWYKGTLPFMDKEQLVMQTRMMPGGSVMDAMFRQDRVNKAGLVSWHDILNPKLKGKMNLQDPTTAGKGGKWVNQALTYYGLDWDFMRALAKQEPVITRDQRLMIEWVVREKHLLAVNPDHDTFFEFKQAGANLDSVIFKESKDVLGGASSGIALLADPPHPSAARLFLNWFLSKEGQTVFDRAYHIQSAREDTPTDHLPEWNIRKPGIDYPVETEAFVLQETKFRPQVVEIFGHLLQ